MKRYLAMMLALLLCCSAAFAEEAQQPERPDFGGEGRPEFGEGQRPEGDGGRTGMDGGPGGDRINGGPAESQPDEALQAILDEVQDKFQLLSYADPDSGIELQYQLFVPKEYDPDESYPLIMFIPDSRAPGREPSYVLSIG